MKVGMPFPSSDSTTCCARYGSGVGGSRALGAAEGWLSAAERLNAANRRVHETWARRDQGSAEHAAWQSATGAARAAYEQMYPQAFWDGLVRLQAGDPTELDGALLFLEVDPWCFRSGYVKERIAQLLTRHELSPGQRERFERVLVHLVDVGDRREFAEFCRLARRAPTQRLRAELRARLRSTDEGVRRRALVMLTSLRRPRLTPDEIEIARDLIFRNARRRADGSPWSANRWAYRLALQLSDSEWAARLAAVCDESDGNRQMMSAGA